LTTCEKKKTSPLPRIHVNILTVDFEKNTLSSELIRCGSKGVLYSFRSPY
jgi:hypothetical protein